MSKIFSKKELAEMNELMLGRCKSEHQCKSGYNKGDYGACVTYQHVLSDAQYADLARRLIKYASTQLNVNRDDLEDTAIYYEKHSSGNRRDGISICVKDDEVLISFAYNCKFVNAIKTRPEKRFDRDLKVWIVPVKDIYDTLSELQKAGADVKNAFEFFKI